MSNESMNKALQKRIDNGDIINQSISSFIRELNSFSDDRLNAVAITDGKKEYTYRQMFRKWEEYAEAFASVDISGENCSRVGLFSFSTIEVIFSLYGLNMTGASVSLIFLQSVFDWDILKKTIQNEGLTDLVLLDNMILPDIVAKLHREKNSLGLRNIIMLHSDFDIPFVAKRLRKLTDLGAFIVSHMPGNIYIDELMDNGKAVSLKNGKMTSDNSSVILHTSGTTSGIKKPIPYSDSAVNEGAARFLRNKEFRQMFDGKAVSVVGSILYSCYFMIDQLHLPLAFGGKLYIMPFGEFEASNHLKAYEKYGVNISFLSLLLFEHISNAPNVDLSKMKLVALGGSYMSPEKKAKIDEYLINCGMEKGSSIGYGLSEAGGACFLTEKGCTEDTIGKPLAGVKFKLFDEDKEEFFDANEGIEKGVLFISTPSISSGRIDDKVFFEHTLIDGEPYINTHDLMKVNDDGSLTCIGRMNKFFTNSEGVRYDSGLVERALAAQKGIVECGIAPEFSKAENDTIPVLYVKTSDSEDKSAGTVKNALINIFIEEGSIESSNLPHHCVIMDDIPYTDTGKVDLYSINQHDAQQERYLIQPEFQKKKLTDIKFIPIGDDEYMDMLHAAVGKIDYEKIIIDFITGKTNKIPFMDRILPMPFGCEGKGPRYGRRRPQRRKYRGDNSMKHKPYFFEELRKHLEEFDEEDRPRRRHCRDDRSCRDFRRDRYERDDHRRDRCRPPFMRRRKSPMDIFMHIIDEMYDHAFDDQYDVYEDEYQYDDIPPVAEFFRRMREMYEDGEFYSPFEMMHDEISLRRRERGIPEPPCMRYYDDDSEENEVEDAPRPRNGSFFDGPLSGFLRHIFNASDYDDFYED